FLKKNMKLLIPFEWIYGISYLLLQKVVTSSSHTTTMSRESDELNDSNEEWDRESGESESGTTATFLSVEDVDAQIELAFDILPVDKQFRQENSSNLPFFEDFQIYICYFNFCISDN